jgi:hypothetical protein
LHLPFLRVAIIARASFNAWAVFSTSLTRAYRFGVYRMHFLPPSVGRSHKWLRKMNWDDKIKTKVRVARSWDKSFAFDPCSNVSLRYRNHFGCGASYQVRVLPTKSCERFKSSLLHSVSQVQSLCLALPLFPSRVCQAHENLHLYFKTKELACGHDLTCQVLWVRGVPKVFQGVPQECRESTLLEKVHESPCFHISRCRSNVVHLDITTKVRTKWMWVYQIDSDNNNITRG